MCGCFSPNGKLILSATSDNLKHGLVTLSYSGDKTLKVWRVTDGGLQQTLEGHSANVLCCCLSPDGSLVMSGSADKSLKLWCCNATKKPNEDPIPSRNTSKKPNEVPSPSTPHKNVPRSSAYYNAGKNPSTPHVANTTHSTPIDAGSMVDTPVPVVVKSASSLEERLDEERCLRMLLEQKLQACEAELAAERSMREDERIGGRRAYAWLHAAQLPPPSLYTEYGVKPLPPAEPLAELYAHLVKSTVCKHRESPGSPTFCPPPQLEVINIHALVNPRLQQKYLAKLDDLEGKHPNGCTPIPCLSYLRIPPVCRERSLNEHLFFHGAPSSAIAKICKGGFNPQRGGEAARNMFGTATYFAANASKADIYTEDSTSLLPRTATRTLILARVALGEAYRADRPLRGISRPPDRDDGTEFDSVWADVLSNGGSVEHLEAMLYSESLAMPVALVDYRHAEACPCAECRRRPSV